MQTLFLCFAYTVPEQTSALEFEKFYLNATRLLVLHCHGARRWLRAETDRDAAQGRAIPRGVGMRPMPHSASSFAIVSR